MTHPHRYRVTTIVRDDRGEKTSEEIREMTHDQLLEELPPLYTDPDGTPLPSHTTYVFQGFRLPEKVGLGGIGWEPAEDPRPPCRPPSNDI